MQERSVWLDVPDLAALLRVLNDVLPTGTPVHLSPPFSDDVKRLLEGVAKCHRHDFEIRSDGIQLGHLAALADTRAAVAPFIEIFVDAGPTRLHGNDLDAGLRNIHIVGSLEDPWARKLLERFGST